MKELLSEGGFSLFRTPVPVLYGRDVLKQLVQVLEWWSLVPERCLVMLDNAMEGSDGELFLRQELARAQVKLETFPVTREPDEQLVAEAAGWQRQWNPQLVIALGGGSTIDAAKASNAMAVHPGEFATYAGFNLFTRQPVPLVAIPTTAGTGSEMGHAAVVVQSHAGDKIKAVADVLYPRLAVLDPLLTVSLPPLPTAYTGMDAIAQAMMAAVATVSQPLVANLSWQALRWLGEGIVPAVANGSDLAGRERMLLGAAMAGMAMYNSDAGLEHALAEVVGGHWGLPHGRAVAAFLPAVARLNAQACPGAFAALYAALTGREPPAENLLPRALEEWLLELTVQLQLPPLFARGVAPAEVSALVPRVREHPCYPHNPVQPEDRELHAILESVML